MKPAGEEIWRSDSEAETVRLGEEFGRRFVFQGVIVCLRGELGAGKTHFIKGIARSQGMDERELTSPTFALAHEFEIMASVSDSNRPSRLFHLDCYRFERPNELLQLGIEDYLYPRHGATIIEWPEQIESLLPPNVINVKVEIISEFERSISIAIKA